MAVPGPLPTTSTSIPSSATDLVQRALDIGDLQGNQHITYNDWFRSLNETHKTVMTKMTEMDDDYSIKEVLVTLTSAYQTTTNSPWEYFVPFPSDFYKLRFVEWQGGTQWVAMDKTNLDNKNMATSFPLYHERNNGLMIIQGMLGTNTSNIRIGYVPQPAIVTVPNTPIQYGLSYSPSDFNLISEPFFCHYSKLSDYDAMIYVYDDNDLVVEINQNVVSGQTGTPVTVFSDSYYTLTGTYYYKGKMYWSNSGGGIWSAPLDLTNLTTIVSPTQVIGTGSDVQFIHIFNNTIYYSTNTLTWTIGTDGTGDTKLFSFPTKSVQVLKDGSIYYIGTGDTLMAGTTVIFTSVIDIANDGNNLYVLDSSGNLWFYPVVSYGVLGTGSLLATDVYEQIGAWSDNRLPVLTQEGRQLMAISAYPNYNFAFTSNVIYDIYSYQLAMDFCRKQKDTERMAIINERLEQLWATYSTTLRRDIYRAPRIRNAYQSYPWGVV